MQSITIFGRKWTDKQGNTYHTASVYVDGSHVLKSLVTSGKEYVDTAVDLLIEDNYLSRTSYMPHKHLQRLAEQGVKVFYECAEVARTIDL